MVRWLSVASAFCLWVFLQPVHALGIGEIKLRSGLNQQFSAVIPLTSLTSQEAEGVRARMADNEDFARAGVDRLAYLSTIDVLVVTDDGNPRIELRSIEIAREPLISLILEVRTVGGPRILREYTILLDPPGSEGSRVSSDRQAPPTPAAATSESSEVPRAQDGEKTAGAATSPAPSDPSTYGPVKRGEALSSIARAVRPDGLPLGQVMSALLAINPDAFVNGDVHNLRSGVMLKIPDAETVRQTRDVVSAAPVVARDPNAEMQETAAPQAEAPARAGDQGEASASSKPPTPSAGAPSKSPAAEVKDGTFGSASTSPTQAVTKPRPETLAEPVIEPEPPLAPPPAGTSSWVKPVLYAVMAVIALLVIAVFLRAVRERKLQRQYEAEREAQALLPVVVPLTEQVLAGIRPRRPREDAQESAEAADDRPPKTPSPAAKTTEEDTAGRGVTGVVGIPIIVGSVAGSAPSGRPVASDVASNFDSGTTKIDLANDDPLAEAEFHQAYGLYDEAALMLQQALAKNPDRTDLSLKLAEIYFAAKRPTEFLQIVEPLKSKLDKDDWGRLAVMGRELLPDSDQFVQAPTQTQTTIAGSKDEMVRVDDGLAFRIEELELPMQPQADRDADAGLDFDLGDFDLGGAEAKAVPPLPETVMSRQDFDLDHSKLSGAGPHDLDLKLEDLELVSLEDELGDELESEVLGTGDDNVTKLDLARAYVEMGDAEMARSLLDEVAQAGTDEQKHEAKSLLDRLAG